MGRELEIEGSVILQKNLEATTRIVVNQGGTRSTKTISLLKVLVILAYKETGEVLSIVRKSNPVLKATVMRDFWKILNELELYHPDNHNMTEQVYHLNGNEIEYFSLDQPAKVRGRKRKYLFINEANELSYPEFQQLILRTTGQIFLDYNPSDEYHWIYDKVLTRDDVTFIQSSYKDNPYLDQETVKEIERLQFEDPNSWKIYGLGERGVSSETIYSHYSISSDFPENPDEIIYGLDFGFNNPAAFGSVAFKDKVAYAKELFYTSHLTNADLIGRIKPLLHKPTAEIFADSAEPKAIEELRRAGLNIKPANKDVSEGIKKVKETPLVIHSESVNMIKEIRNYRWKVDKDGRVLDEPVKFNDHLMDGALRYPIYTHLGKPRTKIIVSV